MDDSTKDLERLLAKGSRKILLAPWQERGIREYERLPPDLSERLTNEFMELKARLKGDLAQGNRDAARSRLQAATKAWKDPKTSPYFVNQQISAEIDGFTQWAFAFLLNLGDG